jgi:energy-coupling factor transport system permease protein
MTLIPTYRSRPSALHAARAGIGAAFCCAFALAGALNRHPLILAGALGGIVVAGVAAGVGREVARSLKLALPLALLLASVNALVYQGGETLLVRGGEFLGRRWDVTLEAAAEGMFMGLRIVVLIAALGGLMSAAVDPDQLLKALRRVSYRSALTATLATRLVPVLARDAGRMGDARRCRPEPPGRLAVVRAALAGSLDRAVDVAAALEVRGYSLGGRPPRRRRPWSRHDLRFLAASLAIVAVAVAGAIVDAAWVEPYPTFTMAWDAEVWALALAVPLLALAPFAGRRARLGIGGRT